MASLRLQRVVRLAIVFPEHDQFSLARLTDQQLNKVLDAARVGRSPHNTQPERQHCRRVRRTFDEIDRTIERLPVIAIDQTAIAAWPRSLVTVSIATIKTDDVARRVAFGKQPVKPVIKPPRPDLKPLQCSCSYSQDSRQFLPPLRSIRTTERRASDVLEVWACFRLLRSSSLPSMRRVLVTVLIESVPNIAEQMQELPACVLPLRALLDATAPNRAAVCADRAVIRSITDRAAAGFGDSLPIGFRHLLALHLWRTTARLRLASEVVR